MEPRGAICILKVIKIPIKIEKIMQFTFLMAVHKKHEYLAMAIESVFNQTDCNFKFHIVANGCTDELWSYLQSLHDSRLKIFRSKIAQLSYSLNYGLESIDGGYVLRIDADDICLPDRLKITRKLLKEFDYPDVLAGSALIINENGNNTGKFFSPQSHNAIVKSLWHRNGILHPACAIKLESIIRLRGYSGGFMSEDYDLWIRASRMDWFKFVGSKEILIKYRIHKDQVRGDILGYAEGAGYQFREFVLQRKIKYLVGAFFSFAKSLFKIKIWLD